MSEDAPTETQAAADGDGADVAPSLAGRRPFSRPTPTNGGRPTSAARPVPFVAPGEPEREIEALAPTAGAVDGEPAEQPEGAEGAETDPPMRETPVAEREGAEGKGENRLVGPPHVEVAAMRWPEPAAVHAALALESLALRLRSGRLRLPVAVNPDSVPALVATVLAAVHADEAGAPAGAPAEPGA